MLNPLKELATLLGGTTEAAFTFIRRVGIGEHHDFDGWDRVNRALLTSQVSNPQEALRICECLVRQNQSGVRQSESGSATGTELRRADVVAALEEAGVFCSVGKDADEICREFAHASAIGRNWTRSIAGRTIDRLEVDELLALLDEQERGSILLIDGPGTGKTCVLLSVAERLEASPSWNLLFLKADEFARCGSEEQLAEHGLPASMAEKCAWLARTGRVAVLIDSLDVLSLHREHRSLRLFLNIVDRLGSISGVTTVVSCRTFDLEYDPRLRGREWNRRLQLRPLSFESDCIGSVETRP